MQKITKRLEALEKRPQGEKRFFVRREGQLYFKGQPTDEVPGDGDIVFTVIREGPEGGQNARKDS